MGARKGGENNSPPCLSCLLKLQLKATNNKGKKGGTTMRNYSPRMKKKKKKQRRKEGKEKEEREKKGSGKNGTLTAIIGNSRFFFKPPRFKHKRRFVKPKVCSR
jgi:hypothetical protein